MDWMALGGELSDVLVGDGGKVTLSLTGVLVGVCFGILSFFPKLIEDPYEGGAILNGEIDRRNKKFGQVMRRVRRTALCLLLGDIVIWGSILASGGPWKGRSGLVSTALSVLPAAGALFIGVGLALFLDAIVRYPVVELTTVQPGGKGK